MKILDFGMHPFADTFISKDLLDKSEPIYPLEVYLDPESGEIKLGIITNDYNRYNLYSYSYTSSNSNFARNHWKTYYEKMQDRFNPSSVVEIGSNDGYLLNMFQCKKLGIDSSTEMCYIARSNGINCLDKIFNLSLSIEIIKEFKYCDLVIANNVLNHSNNPTDFLKGVFNILSNSGVFVFELPYWFDTVLSGRFDQIYHEHISYFTVKYAFNILASAGLELFDFEIVDYHGGSLRAYARKSDNIRMTRVVKEQIKREEDYGLFKEATYTKWQSYIKQQRNISLVRLLNLKIDNPNIPIIGVGAAAKANTFLNYYKLDNSIIDYVTDASPYKIGKYTPLSRIPIVSDEIFSKFENVYAIILSWNISEDLKKILLNINPNIKFLWNI